MDARAHVNNAVYFRYFEAARMGYFEEAGVLTDSLAGSGRGRILASTGCRFRAPLTYPDLVSIGARVARLGRDRFSMEYRAVSHKLDRVAAEGDALVVVYDYDAGRKSALSEDERAAICRLEGGHPPPLED